MNRREHLKLLLAGSVGAGLFLATGCSTKDEEISREILAQNELSYGRTDEEKQRDARLIEERFFTDIEFEMVRVLTEIIIPSDEESGGALDAGVPDFIEFMMKDQPQLQLVTRGGLMWLNSQCNTRFGSQFLDCSEYQRLEMIDEIAWPDEFAPEMQYGVRFFNRMRDLTATGFFTSQIGIEYLDYRGNRPGFWDGVPEDVLEKHGLEYDQKTLDECIREEDRNRIAVWDENMNLL